MGSVSVIIPYYGLCDTRRLKLATKSILDQKGVNIELIVGKSYESLKIKNVSEVDVLAEAKSKEIIPTGGVINQALRIAEGNYTYVSDADIIFRTQTFFGELIDFSKKLQDKALKRPPMRRLLLEDFDVFYRLTNESSLAKAIESFDCSQDYVIKPRGADRPMRIFPKFEKGKQKFFIASEKDFQEYISDERNKGLEPKFFNQDRHCGATFAPTNVLRNIGGYCESFISWGVWDADAQWKLESSIGINLIPKSESFEVIHLDHYKGYFDREKWVKDKAIQKVRRNQGYELSIEQDRLVYLRGEND